MEKKKSGEQQGDFALQPVDPDGDPFEIAWASVMSLTDNFEANSSYYLSNKYQEANARQDFIDLLFTHLGWDVRHDHQHDPYRQEVKIEKSEKKAKGRADYAFSIAPHFKRVRFFVEAKRPQSNIATPDNCFQAIRYSWPKGLPVTVLTDFHSLHIIDSRFRPKIESVTNRVVVSWKYTDFRDRERFSELYYLLSRDAVANGSLHIFAENELPAIQTVTRQYSLFAAETKEFDDDFLDTMDEWREILAAEFKRAKNELSGEQLTECVQRTLDRLVFIRFLEDKGVEPDPIIQNFGTRKIGHWQEFIATCSRLDGLYNGIVFKPHSIIDSKEFNPAGAVFADICDDFADDHSPYDFEFIPVEILGRIYERFLGRIVMADGDEVHVVDKPDVRKAGGVYYTPDYIVAYMVHQSLGPQISGRKPADVLETSVIDTSCGSGSFLIGVYDYLLQTITAYYRKYPKQARKGELEYQDDIPHLSLSYKRRILVHCIYGVDIDPQAVEVAQLSLYLKLMEEETTYTASQQQLEIGSALLPSLSSNIVVGNSLVTLDESGGDMFEIEKLRAVKSLNFKNAFPQVFDRGGFDLVIGNPPYIKEYTNKQAFENVRSSPYYQGKMDIWYLFACRGLDWLKPETGRLAFIATNNWVTNAGASALREKIVSDAVLEQLIDFGDFKVFEGVGIQTMILILRRSCEPDSYQFDYRRLTGRGLSLNNAHAILEQSETHDYEELTPTLNRARVASAPFTFASDEREKLLDKIAMSGNFEFDARAEIAQGIVAPQTGLNKAGHKKLEGNFKVGQGIFVLTDQELQQLSLSIEETKLVKPLYTTTELGKFAGDAKNENWVIYTDSRFKQKAEMLRYPNLKAHLDQFASIITSTYGPYGLHRARKEEFFLGEKIVALRKCKVPTFTFVDFPCYVTQTFNVIKSNRLNLRYLTGLLNSKVIQFWLRYRGKMQGVHYQVDKQPLLALPIIAPTKEIQDEIASLVDQVIECGNHVSSASTDSEKEQIKRIGRQYTRKLDSAIFDIYGIDAAEQDLVDESIDVSS